MTEIAERPQAQDMARIKELMQEWAGYHIDRRHGWATQCSFVNERVQSSRAIEGDYRDMMPPEVALLDREIERFPPVFKKVLRMEFLDRRPQKTKAAVLSMTRERYSQRLCFALEVLDHAMFPYG